MKLIARLAAIAVAAALLFLGVGLWNATRPPLVVSVDMPIEGLPPGTRIRMLHLTDIHYGYPDMRTRRLNAIVTQANALKPDLVVLTGDYMAGKLLDWPKSWLEEALPPLAALKAPMGVWAVNGNHDEPYWTPHVLARQVAPKLLVNSHVDLGPLLLVGSQSAEHGAKPLEALANARAAVPGDKPAILLIHEGDYLSWLKRPVDGPALVLAGHTHGGQIVLPLLGSLAALIGDPPLCRRGLCDIKGWRVFVSSGIGTSWLPARYGVPPEMVLITLHSTGRNSGTER